jgi:hypothetical protein
VDKEANFIPPAVYRIQVREHLEKNWNKWFSGFSVTHEIHGRTILTGKVANQAMLHGLLRRVRDLGLTLISIQRMEAGPKKTESA